MELKLSYRFNPTLVRLRQIPPNRYPPRSRLFQPHAGSIEAPPRALRAFARRRGFNPTLVRLRHLPGDDLVRGDGRFNPTLVRLRQLDQSCSQCPRPLFQPHAGSIEASAFSASQERVRISFNPTLVRLRPNPPPYPPPPSQEFQPHAGSIEARENPPAGDRGDRAEFQPHAGSIEAGGWDALVDRDS